MGRNYKQMGDEKLERTIREFRAGDVTAEAFRKGDIADLPVAESIARERGLKVVDEEEAGSDEPASTPNVRAGHAMLPWLPMLCDEPPKIEVDGIPVPQVPETEGWAMEKKWDGIRLMVVIDQHDVAAFGGRNGSDHTSTVPHIIDQLTWLPPGTVLDGEKVEADSAWSTGATGFTGFVLFDVLRFAGDDLLTTPWEVRRVLLDGMVEKLDGDVVRVGEVFDASQELYEEWVAGGLEGAVCKRRGSLYRPGKRSKDWLKIKPQQTAEAVVIGFKMGKGATNSDRIASLKIQMINADGSAGPESSVACRDYDMEVEVTKNWKKYEGKTLELLVNAISSTGSPRHPVFGRWRPDRDQVAA